MSKIIIIFAVMVSIFIMESFIIVLLWNNIFSEIFKLPLINFNQAFSLKCLILLLSPISGATKNYEGND